MSQIKLIVEVPDGLEPHSSPLLEEAIHRLAGKIVDWSYYCAATREEIKQARKMYGWKCSDEEIQIDHDAAASHTDCGRWVAAWVWVPDEEGAHHV